MRWLLGVLLWVMAASAAAGERTLVSEGPVQMAAERLIVRSERVGREFQVDVWTPNTRPWLPGQKAAAAYILDGGYGMAGPIAAPLGNTDAMQAAYIVTVGYPPGRGMREAAEPEQPTDEGQGGESREPLRAQQRPLRAAPSAAASPSPSQPESATPASV